MLVTTFAQAIEEERRSRQIAQRMRDGIEATRGVREFLSTLEIVPLVDGGEYAMLTGLWQRVAHKKFHALSARVAMRRFNVSGAMANGQRVTLKGIETKLRAYHGALKSLFPVPGEVDPIAVFWDIATKGNFDELMKLKIGPYQDFSLALRIKSTHEVIGGVDFVVYVHKSGPPTVQTNFIFLNKEYRGLKLMRRLLSAQDRAALRFIRITKPRQTSGGFYLFTEQNVPEKMSGRSFVREVGYSLDPIARLRIWRRLNYARLLIDYAQPKLSIGDDPCNFLSLNAAFRRVPRSNSDTASKAATVVRPALVPAKVVYRHLSAFFDQSIGHVPGDDTATKVLRRLRPLASAGEGIATAPYSEEGVYLSSWSNRVRELSEVFAHRKLNETSTISDLWSQYHQKITR